MKVIQKFEFDHCTITHAAYPGGLHMPGHTDPESKISIILNGSLWEKKDQRCVEAGKNSVVIKPYHAVHENLFGHRGVSLFSVSFRKGYPLDEALEYWDWFEDPRISFSAYKLWYSVKSAKNDSSLDKHLSEFVNTISLFRSLKPYRSPQWIQQVENLLRHYPVEGALVNEISEKLGISRVHLSRGFQKHRAISPVRYRHLTRMNELIYCLSSTDKGLAEIAYECGFSDQSHMSRLLLKDTGFTPGALRLLLKTS